MNLTELIQDIGRWLLVVIAALVTIVLIGVCVKFFYNLFMVGWKML